MEPMKPMKPMSDLKFDDAPRWWPDDLGSHPSSAGSADGDRYAYLAATDRLAIQKDGTTEIYDTSGHDIQGVSQGSSVDASLVIHDAAGKTLSLEHFKRLKN